MRTPLYIVEKLPDFLDRVLFLIRAARQCAVQTPPEHLILGGTAEEIDRCVEVLSSADP